LEGFETTSLQNCKARFPVGQGTVFYVDKPPKKLKQGKPNYKFRLKDSHSRLVIELACETEKEMKDWKESVEKIKQAEEEVVERWQMSGALEVADREKREGKDFALSFEAIGCGLFGTEAGTTGAFQITEPDDFEIPQQYLHYYHGPQSPAEQIMEIVLKSDKLYFQLTPRDNQDGTYSVDYCVARASEYSLEIKVRNAVIYVIKYRLYAEAP
jgi:hypothetical protein